MYKPIASLIAAATTATLISCGGPNSQTGAVIGGLGGAAAGGIIGHQSGRGLEGAAIGGALGVVGGALVGDAQDQRNSGYWRNGRRYPSERAYHESRYYRGY